jgi:hypothetical protein
MFPNRATVVFDNCHEALETFKVLAVQHFAPLEPGRTNGAWWWLPQGFVQGT